MSNMSKESMKNSDQSCNNLKNDDLVVNKRGQVRPKTYNSKLKKIKLDQRLECTVLSTSNKEPNDSHAQILNALPNPDVQHEHVTMPLHEQTTVNSEEQEEISDDQEEDPKFKLFDFLKKKEDTTVDDLLRILESENKWINNESEESDEDVDEIDEPCESDCLVNENDPIYPGHHLTIKTSVLLIWLFAITHSMNSSEITSILSLLSLHMMNGGYSALKSLYRFKRFFKNMKSPLVKHYFCSNCLSPLTENKLICDNELCGKSLHETDSKEFFIELPVISQLSALFARNEFRSGLRYRKERVKMNENNIEDIFDSENYKLMSQDDGPLSPDKENNISFIFNTDGIPIFKSSKMSLWPVFLMINELPYRLRKNRENMVMCGLWFGRDKPDMNMFCKPFHETLIELEKGVNISINEQETIKVCGYLYSVSCDIPARSAVMNMNQHNGESCCPKCLQPGVNHRTQSGGNIRIFPYQNENSTGPARDAESVLRDSQQAMDKKITVNGIKGPSFLMFCPRFDPVKCIGIDSMHLLYLGIVRMMLKLWFSVSNSLQPFSIYRFTYIVDSRLTNIKPSHYITRMPRSISEHLKFWKAAEVRSWFFYYSLPCVFDLMNPQYLYHYCTLLEGIFLLNQASISDKDIERSERLLNYSVFMFPSLYDERYVTINMHSLLHLPSLVQQIGPLWSTSCFPFETANGELVKLFHGSQYIDIQITNAVHIFQLLPSLSESIPRTSEAFPFVQTLIRRNHKRRSVGFSLFGKGYPKHIDGSILTSICEILNRPPEKLLFYKRAIIRGIMYHSSDYTRAKKRNSFTVK